MVQLSRAWSRRVRTPQLLVLIFNLLDLAFPLLSGTAQPGNAGKGIADFSGVGGR